MSTRMHFVRLLALIVLVVAGSSAAHAQATRTWVSGVGNDADPCSRTGPCKTFAGAFSKTASGGEINVLDPGGFGAVTITKPLTISSWGFEAGVLVSGTNGIIVNVPNATDRVILRGLDIEGLGTGLSGVTVVAGGNVTVENSTINRFTVSGVNFTPTVAGSALHLSNVVIRNNGTLPSSGQGVLIAPTSTATATLDNVRLEANVAGLKAQGSSNTEITNSIAANNNFAGFSGAASPAVMTIEHSAATHNGTGVVCAAGTTVRIGDMSLSGNVSPLTSGACFSFKNNDIDSAVTINAISPTPQ